MIGDNRSRRVIARGRLSTGQTRIPGERSRWIGDDALAENCALSTSSPGQCPNINTVSSASCSKKDRRGHRNGVNDVRPSADLGILWQRRRSGQVSSKMVIGDNNLGVIIDAVPRKSLPTTCAKSLFISSRRVWEKFLSSAPYTMGLPSLHPARFYGSTLSPTGSTTRPSPVQRGTSCEEGTQNEQTIPEQRDAAAPWHGLPFRPRDRCPFSPSSRATTYKRP